MRTTIEQWRVFRALVEHGSYAAAAESVHKSVSSVHTAIQKLQLSLGVDLFTVTGRRIALTEPGRQLIRRANGLIDQVQTIEYLAEVLADGQEAGVRLAVETIYPRAHLHKVLASLADAFPQVRIELFETVIHGAADLFERGEVNIAITPSVPRSGTFQTLGRVRFSPVAHPDHRLHQLGRSLTLDDLRTARHIVVRDSSPQLDDHKAWLQAPDYWTVGSMDMSIELIVKGLGFAWLPLSRIHNELAAGELKPLPMRKLNDHHVELYLAHTDTEITGPVCEFLLRSFSDLCETMNDE